MEEKFGQPQEFETLIKKYTRVPQITWGLLLVFFFLYMYSTKNLIDLRVAEPRSSEAVHFFAKSFSVCCLILFFLSWFLPRLFLQRAEKNNTSKYRAAYRGFMLRESFLFAVGFFGYILSFLSGQWSLGLPMILAGLIGLLLNFPTKRRLRLEGAELSLLMEESRKPVDKIPLPVKILAWLMIVGGCLDGAIGGYAHVRLLQHLINEQSPLLLFGHFQTPLLCGGAFLLIYQRVKVRKAYRLIIAAAILFFAVNGVREVTEAREKAMGEQQATSRTCIAECERLFKAGQLKAGVDADACVQASCSN